MHHNALTMIDPNHQPIDVIDEDIYPFQSTSKVIAMLTPFPEDLEKLLHGGRPGENTVKVSDEGKIDFIDHTAWEWERVL